MKKWLIPLLLVAAILVWGIKVNNNAVDLDENVSNPQQGLNYGAP